MKKFIIKISDLYSLINQSNRGAIILDGMEAWIY